MPHIARMDAPGVINHLIIRGIEKGAIFRDQVYRKDFMRQLEEMIAESRPKDKDTIVKVIVSLINRANV